ncbi:MAG: hypothetical protein AAF628_35595 [Planctomycetota bacterium]
MDIHERLWVDRLDPGAKPTDAPKPQAGAFQHVLDQLREGEAGAPPPPGEAEAELRDFTDAVARADSDFATLMDLRRRLEDAFKRHQ